MWSTKDLKWLKEKYPALKKISSKKLEGRISFQMLRLNSQYFVNPSLNQIEQLSAPDYLYLCGSYKIRIELNEPNSYPVASEIGGKIAAIAKKLEKDDVDMHLYPDGTLCLAAPMDLDIEFVDGFELEIYIEKCLIPYLFAQTYYAKEQVWIWGDLNHGIWGLLEWLGRRKNYNTAHAQLTYSRLQIYGKQENVDIKVLLGTRCRNHKPCPCGSNKKTRRCHPDVQQGIARLRNAISCGLINFSEDI